MPVTDLQYPRRIISGGQTGVDRAALDMAIELGIQHGGWCPVGRRAEDGTIDLRYKLKETASEDYGERTLFNVRDSDGTLILNTGELEGGSRFTADVAGRLDRPALIIDLVKPPDINTVREWLSRNRIGTLNIAGPRESKRNGIQLQAMAFLRRLLASQ
jgi:hypothetical protein